MKHKSLTTWLLLCIISSTLKAQHHGGGGGVSYATTEQHEVLNNIIKFKKIDEQFSSLLAIVQDNWKICSKEQTPPFKTVNEMVSYLSVLQINQSLFIIREPSIPTCDVPQKIIYPTINTDCLIEERFKALARFILQDAKNLPQGSYPLEFDNYQNFKNALEIIEGSITPLK